LLRELERLVHRDLATVPGATGVLRVAGAHALDERDRPGIGPILGEPLLQIEVRDDVRAPPVAELLRSVQLGADREHDCPRLDLARLAPRPREDGPEVPD